MIEVSRKTVPNTLTTEPLPPIKCTPWCEKGDGHVDAGHPDDQYCSAGDVEIELERDPEQLVPGGAYYRREITASLQQDPFSEPFVPLHAPCVELTLDEAEALAGYLNELVQKARGTVA